MEIKLSVWGEMKPYQKERIENAISFFAKEHQKKTKQSPSQTHIYKYLAYFDFQVLKETGKAPLDLEYIAMKRGPVPIDIYSQRREIESDLFAFEEIEDNKFIVKSKKVPNLDFFSKDEIQKMNELIYIFASKYTTATIMSNSSHEQIQAWKKAWERKENSRIDKTDTFQNVHSKPDEELTAPEEHFLLAEALKRAGC